MLLLFSIINVYLNSSTIIRFAAPPPQLRGALAANPHLQKVSKLYQGHIIGPESFAGDGKGTI